MASFGSVKKAAEAVETKKVDGETSRKGAFRGRSILATADGTVGLVVRSCIFFKARL